MMPLVHDDSLKRLEGVNQSGGVTTAVNGATQSLEQVERAIESLRNRLRPICHDTALAKEEGMAVSGGSELATALEALHHRLECCAHELNCLENSLDI